MAEVVEVIKRLLGVKVLCVDEIRPGYGGDAAHSSFLNKISKYGGFFFFF